MFFNGCSLCISTVGLFIKSVFNFLLFNFVCKAKKPSSICLSLLWLYNQGGGLRRIRIWKHEYILSLTWVRCKIKGYIAWPCCTTWGPVCHAWWQCVLTLVSVWFQTVSSFLFLTSEICLDEHENKFFPCELLCLECDSKSNTTSSWKQDLTYSAVCVCACMHEYTLPCEREWGGLSLGHSDLRERTQAVTFQFSNPDPSPAEPNHCCGHFSSHFTLVHRSQRKESNKIFFGCFFTAKSLESDSKLGVWNQAHIDKIVMD